MDNARAQTSRLLDLLRCEQGAMADFLLALSAFDRERLWVGMGYGSLFHYLVRELKLSNGSAFLRKTAADLLQRFPEVEAPLREGRLCLSSVGELAKVLTQENRTEVLPRFFYASKNDAKALAAEIAPREAIPQRVVVTTVAPRELASRAAAMTAEAQGRAGAALLPESRRPLPAGGLDSGRRALRLADRRRRRMRLDSPAPVRPCRAGGEGRNVDGLQRSSLLRHP